MKNLRTGNYTEFRNISDGFHIRPQRKAVGSKCGGLNMTILSFAKVSNYKNVEH